MSASPALVIVGSGLAGHTLARSLASFGYAGSVTLVGEEHHAPYDRPPLSKEFQRGDESTLMLQADGLAGVQVISGCKAVAIDTDRRALALSDGRELPWDSLVLATGARPRPLAGSDPQAPVHFLRTLDDARAIRAKLRDGLKLTVIGGGPIGLELAASAGQLGARVTVLEAAPRLMARTVSPTIAEFLLEHHRASGAQVLLGAQVKAVQGGGVELADGRRVEADLVVVGIGVVANDDLAHAAGIATDDGIFVDANFRTTQPDVYAIGDVTRQRNPISGRFERIETWSNARTQAQALARQLCAGTNGAPRVVTGAAAPWFWSDQGNLRLQCAGLPQGDQEVRRGDPATGLVVGQWSAGRLVGVAAINAPQDFNLLRRILDAGQSMTPEAFASSTELRSPPNHTPEGPAEPVPVTVTPSDAPAALAPSAPLAQVPSTLPPPPPPPAQGTAPDLAACPLEDIEEGAIGSTSLPDGTRIAIYRIQGDEVFATDDKCSHGSSSLCDEGSLEGHLIECGLHLGSFDVRTGKPVSAPCTKAIRSYPAQVRNGTIWIATQPIEPSP